MRQARLASRAAASGGGGGRCGWCVMKGFDGAGLGGAGQLGQWCRVSGAAECKRGHALERPKLCHQ